MRVFCVGAREKERRNLLRKGQKRVQGEATRVYLEIIGTGSIFVSSAFSRVFCYLERGWGALLFWSGAALALPAFSTVPATAPWSRGKEFQRSDKDKTGQASTPSTAPHWCYFATLACTCRSPLAVGILFGSAAWKRA